MHFSENSPSDPKTRLCSTDPLPSILMSKSATTPGNSWPVGSTHSMLQTSSSGAWSVHSVYAWQAQVHGQYTVCNPKDHHRGLTDMSFEVQVQANLCSGFTGAQQDELYPVCLVARLVVTISLMMLSQASLRLHVWSTYTPTTRPLLGDGEKKTFLPFLDTGQVTNTDEQVFGFFNHRANHTIVHRSRGPTFNRTQSLRNTKQKWTSTIRHSLVSKNKTNFLSSLSLLLRIDVWREYSLVHLGILLGPVKYPCSSLPVCKFSAALKTNVLSLR